MDLLRLLHFFKKMVIQLFSSIIGITYSIIDYIHSFFQKQIQNEINPNVRHKKNFLSAASNSEERKVMLEKELNGIDNSF